MVPRESVPDPGETLMPSVPLIERCPDGRWRVHLRIDGDIDVGDGRTIPLHRTLTILAYQDGRKPPAR